MSAAIVQENGTAASTSPVVITLASNTTAGTLLVIATIVSNNDTVTSITDDASGGSNTYVQVPSAAAVRTGIEATDIWYCVNNKGGAKNITVNFSSGGVSNPAAVCLEVSGIVTSSPVDTGSGGNVSNGTSSGTTANGPTIVATQSDFVIAFGDSQAGFASVASPFSLGPFGEAVDLNSASGSITPVFTTNGSNEGYLISMAAFKVFTVISFLNFVGQVKAG